MAKGLARTFGQDLMRGEHAVGEGKTNGGVLMPSHTSGDPSFYAKKRARETELGRALSTEEFLAEHYEASEAPTASGTSIFDPVLCEIACRWFCPPGGTVLDPFAGGSVRGVVASRLGFSYVGVELRADQVAANQAQAALGARPAPRWITGDSRDIGRLAKAVEADLIFSCPPTGTSRSIRTIRPICPPSARTRFSPPMPGSSATPWQGCARIALRSG